MSTKLNNVAINPKYEGLFTFESKKEKIEHNAQMISYRVLSEVEKVCEEKKIKKKDLAELVGTSKSYITQLFRGDKHVNTYIIAKFEDALNISFEIKAKLNEDTYEEFLGKQITTTMIKPKRFVGNDCVWHLLKSYSNKKQSDLIENMETDNPLLQKVG